MSLLKVGIGDTFLRQLEEPLGTRIKYRLWVSMEVFQDELHVRTSGLEKAD